LIRNVEISLTMGNDLLLHGGGVVSATPFERSLDQTRSEEVGGWRKEVGASHFLKLTSQIMPVP
jgi:hypothetical protein